MQNFASLFEQADRLQPRVPIAVAGGDDTTVIEALAETTRRGWTQPLLCGDCPSMLRTADRCGVDHSLFEWVEAARPASAAVALIKESRAAMLMKGQIATPDLMRAVLDSQSGLRTGATIGQVVLMEIPKDDRCFLLTDTGINLRPSTEQLFEMISAAATISQSIGCQSPHVAMMAASEKENEAMPETLLASMLQEMKSTNSHNTSQTGQVDFTLHGPTSFDLAYSKTAIQRKRLTDERFQVADVMVFPNLLSERVLKLP
ncbi:phosphate butyryltransferase [Rhodopirellula sp. JC740]|uniref:Phosphate butyryltransferase n=1 Tax=Rhodopirellula halodulae TaxID=2894198 RepID=A0ABS8NIZ9_9BACT|nr:phosphate acyltransferase [Rhodopirellula sp. JC740]MCC9643529.1 phosphate butyryltransferase [Rhodopirellula sp. JC740]